MSATSSLRIGIAGINGRVGRLLVEEIQQSGAILAGGTARRVDIAVPCPCFDDLAALAPLCDVVIDFTHAQTARQNAQVLAGSRVKWVLGTTGLDEAQQAAVKAASALVTVVQAANFSPGLTLVRRMAQMMGATLGAPEYDAEIVEMHHRQKVDAPSGTALAIGEAVAAGRGVTLADVRVDGRRGHTGPRGDQEIGFSSLRGGQIVGEHELLLTSATEQIGLSHRAFDRRIFATGAVRAAIWAASQPAGLYGLEDVLGLPPVENPS